MAKSRSVLITCKVPVELVDIIDKMVDEGIFSSRSEAIRYAIGSMISLSNESRQGIDAWSGT